MVGYALWESKERMTMTERIDEAKGRTKEAAGDLTDDKRLKREGKIDRAASTAKEKIDQAADKVKDKVGVGRDREADRDRESD
jgi:uncharacterized protein YjbJ (UPF0337 family)